MRIAIASCALVSTSLIEEPPAPQINAAQQIKTREVEVFMYHGQNLGLTLQIRPNGARSYAAFGREEQLESTRNYNEKEG